MIGIEAPWHNYHKKVYNLFNGDPEVTVDNILTKNDDGTFEFTISSKNGDKLNAIENLLGYGKVFGNVRVLIKYGYENVEGKDWANIYKTAFTGNPLFSGVVECGMPLMGTNTYAIFKKDIVTFYDDNLSDYHGNSHYIVADLVKDVVADPGIFICTSNE